MQGSGHPLRVALADGHAPVRAGLREALERIGVVVAFEAEDGKGLLDALLMQPVDAILSDTRMPGMDGMAALRELRATGDRTPVLLLTGFDESDLPLHAGEVGAQGFLRRDATDEDLREAIGRVATRRRPPPAAIAEPVRESLPDDDAPPPDGFSDREVAILRLLASGGSNQDIARSLSLAEGTVKAHVSTILDKLGTHDRARAVLKAIALRVI